MTNSGLGRIANQNPYIRPRGRGDVPIRYYSLESVEQMRRVFFVGDARNEGEVPVDNGLSELIRTGARLVDGQAVGDWVVHVNGKVYSCAMAMASQAINLSPYHPDPSHELAKRVGYYPHLVYVAYPHKDERGRRVGSFGESDGAYASLPMIVRHLNDVYAWNVVLIVDWLRQLGL